MSRPGHGALQQKLDYFEKLASQRASDRKRYAYYWDDISHTLDYFIHEEDSILEVGCGTGELLDQIKGKAKIGIDFSPRMIEIAKRQFPKIEFQVMTAESLTLERQFDVIILSNLIGHLEDVQKVFKELKKVCHPRTRIIITYFNHLWAPLLSLAEWAGLKTKTFTQNWLSKTDIANLLYLAGFETYRTAKRMLLPIDIPLVSFLINNILARLPLLERLALNWFVFARPMRTESAPGRKEHTVSIIIPARNERGNIEEAIRRIPRFGKRTEIIFVEGHSADGTWEKIRRISKKYKNSRRILCVRQEGIGKANAVRYGFELASHDLLMILDADLTAPPETLPKFYDAIASGKGDFAMGSRLIYPVEGAAMRFLNMLGNKFFGSLFSWLLDQPIKDTLCGTKVLFRSDYLKLSKNRQFFGEFDPFGDFDLIFGAFKLNLKIIEIPIRYQARAYGTTNISRLRHGLLLLKMCLLAAKKIKFY